MLQKLYLKLFCGLEFQTGFTVYFEETFRFYRRITSDNISPRRQIAALNSRIRIQFLIFGKGQFIISKTILNTSSKYNPQSPLKIKASLKSNIE